MTLGSVIFIAATQLWPIDETLTSHGVWVCKSDQEDFPRPSFAMSTVAANDEKSSILLTGLFHLVHFNEGRVRRATE